MLGTCPADVAEITPVTDAPAVCHVAASFRRAGLPCPSRGRFRRRPAVYDEMPVGKGGISRQDGLGMLLATSDAAEAVLELSPKSGQPHDPGTGAGNGSFLTGEVSSGARWTTLALPAAKLGGRCDRWAFSQSCPRTALDRQALHASCAGSRLACPRTTHTDLFRATPTRRPHRHRSGHLPEFDL